MAHGASNPWEGWWGDDPPSHMPVFVLTHNRRELLGDGIRLFDRLGPEPIELERTRVIESPGVTHLRFRVVR